MIFHRDAEGRIFFDRDPTHFRYILNYLREGAFVLPYSVQDRMELAQEARYVPALNMLLKYSAGPEKI